MPPRGKTTIQDVARMADVSPTTVSMILRGKPGVSFAQETIDRVLNAAEQLNYKKTTARGCFDRPTIALIMGTVTSIYSTFLAQSITQKANEAGMDTLIFEDEDQSARQLRCIHAISQMGVAGVIYIHLPYKNNMSVAIELSRRIPTVIINDRNIDLPIDSVLTDSLLCGKMTAAHLFELGHRDIAFIEIDRWQGQWTSPPLQGVQEYLQKYPDVNLTIYKRPAANRLRPGSFIESRRLAREMAETAIANGNHTGFICVSDYCAYGVLDALASHNLKIPDDYSVCACDNLYPSDLPGISLTTIDRHAVDIGVSCFELLYQRMSSHTSNSTERITRIEYRSTLVVRNSTGAPRKV